MGREKRGELRKMKERIVMGICGIGVALMMAFALPAQEQQTQEPSGGQAQSQSQQDQKPDAQAPSVPSPETPMPETSAPKVNNRWTASELAALQPEAKPGDVASPIAIVNAAYDVISGPAGERDWKRFRSLFLPTARLGTLARRKDGNVYVMDISAQDYVDLAGPSFAKEGFFERGIVNHVNKFGDMAEVFSSYESRKEKNAEPFARGINNFQLMFDGKRWWIESIVWDEEHDGLKLPASMAKREGVGAAGATGGAAGTAKKSAATQ